MKRIPKFLAVIAISIVFTTNVQAAGETIKTRIGSLSFTHDFANGYPTLSTQQKLFDEMDFQRACQAYLWSIPIVSMAQWQWAHENQLGAKNGQIVYCATYTDKLGGLTYNTTTPYVLPFIDLTDGPWVVDLPEGEIRGAFNDFWQIGEVQIKNPNKYLLVGPGQEVPKNAENKGYTVVKMSTFNILPGIRLMSQDDKERLDFVSNVKIYPYSERANPKPRG